MLQNRLKNWIKNLVQSLGQILVHSYENMKNAFVFACYPLVCVGGLYKWNGTVGIHSLSFIVVSVLLHGWDNWKMATAHVLPAAAKDLKNFPANNILLKLIDNCSGQSLKAHVQLLQTILDSINNTQYSIIKLKTFYYLARYIFLQS